MTWKDTFEKRAVPLPNEGMLPISEMERNEAPRTCRVSLARDG